jgi:very-short-patch-repair endonuclease
MAAPSRTVEQIIGDTARAQHGVVTRAQLLDAGLTRHEIAARLRSGMLLRVYPGVYRVGHAAPSVEADYLAAVYACGEGAVLSGLAAAHLLGLVKGSAPAAEVTCPTQRRVRGVLTHRSRAPGRQDAIVRNRIPCTSVPRTLVDIAAVLPEEQLARACHEAGVRFGTTPADVRAVLRRRTTSAGARKLRRIMEGDVRVTLSSLEQRFVALVRDAGLPLPGTNRPAGGRRVDCRWPNERLTVELDSYRYHRSRHAWEADRHREREAYARGDDFRRYTYDDVFVRPRAVLRELENLLPKQGDLLPNDPA